MVRADLLLFRLGRLAAVLGLALPAVAQTGSIAGHVVDEAGQPVSFVEVLLEGEESPVSESAHTADDGTFRFPSVPPGNYRLSARDDGRASPPLGSVTVQPGSKGSYTLELRRVGDYEDRAEVTEADDDLMRVEDTESSIVLSRKFLKEVPLQSKDIESIVFLAPGISRTGSSESDDISATGGESTSIGISVDGNSNNDAVTGGKLFDVSAAAIDRVKVIMSGFTADRGTYSAAIVELVTRSGTDVLNFGYSMDFRDTRYGAQRLAGLDETNAAVDRILRGEGTLLEAEIRDGFALLGIDAISTTDDDSNPPLRHRVRHSISAGGPVVKGKSWFHSTVDVLADDSGSPLVRGAFESDQILWNSKVDWNLWRPRTGPRKNDLELTANLDVDDSSGWAGVAASRGLNTVQTSGTWTLGANDTHVFGPSTVLETRLNLTHHYRTSRPEDERAGVGTRYVIALPPGGFTTYAVGAAAADFDLRTDVVRGEIALTRHVGSHTFKAGVTGQRTSYRAFTELGTRVTDLRVIDDRSALEGTPALVGDVVDNGAPVVTNATTLDASAYITDNWQVTDNLTLDIGVRADYQSFVGEIFPSPRFGFSLDPIGDRMTRFYGHWGVFTDNLFANALDHANTPDQKWSDLQFASQFGSRSFDDIAIDDIYQEALTTRIGDASRDAVAFLVPSRVYRYVLSDSLTAPTSKTWSLGIERRLPGKIRMQVAYTASARTHQLSTTTFDRSLEVDAGGVAHRDIVLETTGEGQFRQWAFEIQRPVAKTWELNFSYVQAKNKGPLAPPDEPLDPNDVFFDTGTLGNDRTHVVKMQGHGLVFPERLGLRVSADFTWQSGTPFTASFTDRDRQTFYPIGRNTLRLPSTRQLNFGIGREWKDPAKPLSVSARLSVFNVLNEMNVVGGFGVFKTPNGSADPQAFPPLRPDLLVTSVDVSRSAEFSLTIGF